MGGQHSLTGLRWRSRSGGRRAPTLYRLCGSFGWTGCQDPGGRVWECNASGLAGGLCLMQSGKADKQEFSWGGHEREREKKLSLTASRHDWWICLIYV